MARAKKNETTMTLEEKLEQALVPDWEWPYKLPSNWCWVYQKSLCHLFDGEKRENASFPYWDVKSLRGTKERQYVSSGKFVRKGTKVILVDGENSGEIFDIPEDGYMGSTFKALLISPLINVNYLRYYIASKQDFYRKHKVGSAIPHLNKEMFLGMPFPLAPCIAQQHVVDHIESLFARLDEAKEKAQATVDSFETRKASILHKAFTGELTANWREMQGVGMDSWKHHAFRELCSDIVRGGSPRPAGSPEFYDGPIPFMKVADITRNDSPFVSSAEYSIKEAGLKKTRMVSANTLLLTNSGATLGVPAICTFQTTFNDGIAAFLGLPEDSLMFYYYFWTSKTAELRMINQGAAQPNLNTTIIGSVELDVPSDPEKQEIVRVLENFFTKEKKAKEAAAAVLEQIDLMKKAILSRAFRGELGTNNPTEESALELLKQILSGKTADIKLTKKSVSTTRIPVEIAAMLYTRLEKDIVKLFYQHSDTNTSIDEILAVGKNKMGIINTLTNLEQRGIIVRLDQTNYCIKE